MSRRRRVSLRNSRRPFAELATNAKVTLARPPRANENYAYEFTTKALPEPWRQLWATSLGQTLAVVLVIYYRRKLKARQSRNPQADAPRLAASQ